MALRVTLIGFGEAGKTFACAAEWGQEAAAYDIKTGAVSTRAAKLADYADAGVRASESLVGAIENSPLILSLVTADQSLTAARAAARHIAPGALFLDMNSVAPATKVEAAQAIEGAGGRYVDAAIMSPVDPAALAVPLLLSGSCAQAGVEALAALKFTCVRAVPGPVGRASTIKMIRSVMVKGMEALTAECLIAAARADVVDEVMASLGADWAAKADYRLERMMRHGLRRAAEMEEAAATLEALGLAPEMTRATVRRQREIGEAVIDPIPEGLAEKLERLVA